eukprot:scaffold5571_cov142-Isochrysis_galbana.AAC.8
MSISSYASDHSAASNPHSCEIIESNPSRQSGMVQPVVNEMFATVHAAGSSLLVRGRRIAFEGVPPNTIGVEGLVFKNNHEVDNCLGGSLCLCRGDEEDADGLVLAGGGGEGKYEGVF